MNAAGLLTKATYFNHHYHFFKQPERVVQYTPGSLLDVSMVSILPDHSWLHDNTRVTSQWCLV